MFDAFGALKGAIRTRDYVFIRGRRNDRILLVAHADTAGTTGEPVWMGDAAVTERWGLGYSAGKDNVLGADDRAGCALMYNIFDGQHSVLITTGEERGCIGAKAALREISDELEHHHFALQVDRRGDRQAVFYQCGTEPFQTWMMAQLNRLDYDAVEWSKEPGSWTDIAEMCPQLGICGVNLSAGYLNEHSSQEILLLGSWLHTRTVVKRIIQQTRIPQFLMQKARYAGRHPFREESTTGNFYRTRGTVGGTQTDRKTEPMIKFQNRLVPLSELSNKQRKALIKGIKKQYEKKLIVASQAIDMIMQILPKNRKLSDVFPVPPRAISEQERSEHWTGETWERRDARGGSSDTHGAISGPVVTPDPNDKVRYGETPRVPHWDTTAGSKSTAITKRLKYCKHYVLQGRYCEKCVGVVGFAVPTSDGLMDLRAKSPAELMQVFEEADKEPKLANVVDLLTEVRCDHGVLIKDHCEQCAPDPAAVSETNSRVRRTCKHGQSIYLLCTDCEIEIANASDEQAEEIASRRTSRPAEISKPDTCIHNIGVHLHCAACDGLGASTEKVKVVPLPLLPPARRSLSLVSVGRASRDEMVNDKIREGFTLGGDGTCNIDH